MFKKTMAVALLLVTTLFLTACPGAGLMPVHEIIDEAVLAVEDVTTYRFELDMSMDLALEAEGESYKETISMGLSGALDLEDQEMMMAVFMTVAMFGEGMEMSGEIYLVDEMMYTMIEDSELGSIWNKIEVPEGFWDEINQVEPQVELLEVVQAEVLGSERIGDVDCYVLDLTPDMEQLWQLAMQQSGVTGEEFLPEFDTELLQDMFQDFCVKQWIAKDTYYIAKAEMSIEMEVTPEAMGYPDEEGIMTMDITMELLAYDYNQPISIVLPAGAEEAIEATMSQGIVDEANYEALDVDMAVLEAMIDYDIYELTAGGTVGPGYASSVYAADGVTELDITPYLYSYLEATYTLDEYGWIVAAVAEPGGRWDGLTYIYNVGWVE